MNETRDMNSVVDTGSCRSFFREPLLAGSHLVGAIVGFIALIALFQSPITDSVKLFVIGVYAAAFTIQFVASTIWHGRYHADESEMLLFEKLDYAAIYLFIAGTYTPLCFFGLPSDIGNVLLAIEWTAALIGVYTTLRYGFSRKRVQVIIFLTMGWVFVVALTPLIQGLSDRCFDLLLSGVAFYTVGSGVFSYAPPEIFGGKICSHFIWHLLVLAGAFCHLGMVYYLIRV